ncbi:MULTISPECIES: aromatic amino acid lyase [unclassified Lysobacter]|uniref:HAL/PAL/TAL family ammonia-lyase n=1 Tax=unclassified Lysobacter TaxID=2635362 RepID=UPI001BE95629|nr:MULTISPECIES: aromatic amino acid lyase [unclassified Lysobacter]MBT2746547.1 aromatic amino acid lyase [Lysobacter sp. ISL-42]MBT2754000.1 aromatic amino acid lyase [Lysobacter sp. ISL-50]MBT2778926.1 aromatic amino acid lyase [Lysobacter sp. ISL-54]MBT2782497.1 aromatic amino acid lyase [Lysobacter sp. ISL-52]
MNKIQLDGRSLTRSQLVAVAYGAQVELAAAQLPAVARAADFLAEQVRREEPIYGVSTGFGSNADRLLGSHHLRDQLPGAKRSQETLHEELQRNLIVTHAVCVGDAFAPEIVRAMLCIRVNTLMRGHSGIRVETLQALTAMLNAGIVPVVPQLGSVGASGDLAPLSHLAIVLLGGGEAFFAGERMPGAQALERAGLKPVKLSYKEGLALNNGTAQMLACGVLALARLEDMLDTADLAAAMTIDAFAGRLGAFAEEVHALRPHPGQVQVAENLRKLLDGSTLADIPYHLVPRFRPWLPQSWDTEAAQQLSFDIGWDWVPFGQRHGREKFYNRFRPFRGGKKHQPQDSYSLRCIPQVHGAVRDAIAQAARVLEIELNSLTDNPIVFPDAKAEHVEQQVISAGHFHGMPLALAMSYVKAAIPVLASISERRLNKLVDPATNDGLPGFLIGNEDATESGHMIVQYTAAAIVNDLASRAHPASVYSIPTSANAEDHVSMGANEARHVLAMADDLGKVLALELYTAAQALDLRRDMINAARDLADRADAATLAAKVFGGPAADSSEHAGFIAEVEGLRAELSAAAEFRPGRAVAIAHAKLREAIAFLDHDRALDGEVATAVRLVRDGTVLSAVRAGMRD